ncbi:MAG: hypothetical protein QXU67_02865 [Candidatus Bathyarchaeia archaeon]
MSKALFHLLAYLQGRGSIIRNTKYLLKTQSMPTKDIEILQFEKLRKIVSYAYAKVPYYKMKFDEAGFSPEKFRNIEDIEKIPILTKEDIQKNTERFISVDFRKDDLLKNSTGGSTGYPLIFYHSRQYQNWATADIHRHFTWCGHQVGERFALLWGSDYDYNRVNKLRRDIENYIKNWLWINTFNIREAEFAEHIVRLKQFRPVFLIGYASSLHMLARILKKNSEKIESIDAVESSAELLYPRQRKDIESILNCRVFDRYGCREVGNIAHECKEHKGLHISSENNFVEFLDKYGQSVGYGKEGRVVVTNLNNFAFPFIRYDVGDIGSPLGKECSCGINFL